MSERQCDGCRGSWGEKGETFTYLYQTLYLCEDCAQAVYVLINKFHKEDEEEEEMSDEC